MSPAIRREVHYSGQVQGVGFRYTTHAIARDFAVMGFVRNLADGRVQLVAEGAPSEVDQFLAAVSDRMAGYIQDAKADSGVATGGFATFEIRT